MSQPPSPSPAPPSRRHTALVGCLVVAAVVAGGLHLGAVGAATGASGDGTTEAHPSLVAVYPNPIPDGDPGEYVVLRAPDGTDLGAYTLSDGESRLALPSRTVDGTVWLTTDPEAARTHSGPDPPPVVALNGSLSLSNGGERVRLLVEPAGAVVSTLRYGRTGEGEVWRDGRAVPRGRTDLPPLPGGTGTTARAFVLPDGPEVPLTAVHEAEERILLAGYTFSSRRVAAALRAAAARGVSVRVLVEGGPVGGVSTTARSVLSQLAASAVQVRVLDGPASRYRFHHPKYAVVDDSALVTSENWDPGGLGGHATRGWGALVHDPTLADHLAGVFSADWDFRAATRWPAYAAVTTFHPDTPSTATYHTRFAPRTVPVRSATLVTAPDNAERTLLRVIRRAERRVRVIQPSVGNQTPLRTALVAAARRGVRVQLLLSGTWYAEAENEATARALHAIARAEDLPLSVRLASPRSRYGHLHAKGVLVDGEVVVLGSINWNTVSTRANREVAVILRGEAVATYFGRTFRADWRGAAWRVPAGVVAAGLATVGVTVLLVARAVRFDATAGRRRPEQPPPSSRRAGRGPPRERRGRT